MADPELAARIRAAFAYADLSKAQRAEALNVSERQITRIESGQVDIDLRRLAAVAGATGVPISFFDGGWPADEPQVADRVEALEHQYSALRLELAETKAAAAEGVAGLAGSVAQLQREIAALAGGRRRTEPGEGNAR